MARAGFFRGALKCVSRAAAPARGMFSKTRSHQRGAATRRHPGACREKNAARGAHHSHPAASPGAHAQCAPVRRRVAPAAACALGTKKNRVLPQPALARGGHAPRIVTATCARARLHDFDNRIRRCHHRSHSGTGWQRHDYDHCKRKNPLSGELSGFSRIFLQTQPAGFCRTVAAYLSGRFWLLSPDGAAVMSVCPGSRPTWVNAVACCFFKETPSPPLWKTTKPLSPKGTLAESDAVNAVL